MGKAERNRMQAARERIAAQQAAAKKAEARRRAFIAGGSVLAVIAVVLGLIIWKSANNPSSANTAGKAPVATAATDAALASQLTSVPASVLNSVGAGPAGSVSPLQPVTGNSQLLTSGGKPEMLYVGAGYCPYCAAERWAMAVALSRFGTFSGLHFIRSDGHDVYSNTSTLTFYKSAYTSQYLVFTPVEETATNPKVTLQAPTSAQLALMKIYDAPPYIQAGQSGSFPFVDVGNKYIADGAQYQPSVLGSTQNVDASHFGLTWQQIAQDLKNPSNPVAQAILGSANHITAAICKITNGQPASVCSSAAVKAVGSQI